jgi:hypothetical protein
LKWLTEAERELLKEYDDFDICEAFYEWLSTHYNGVVHGKDDSTYSISYNRMCSMESELKFKPRPTLGTAGRQALSEEGRLIHDELCKLYPGCDCLTYYKVVVGNVGTVYEGSDEDEAKRTYTEYVTQSKTPRSGRAAGESVTLMHGGEVHEEHTLEEGHV